MFGGRDLGLSSDSHYGSLTFDNMLRRTFLHFLHIPLQTVCFLLVIEYLTDNCLRWCLRHCYTHFRTVPTALKTPKCYLGHYEWSEHFGLILITSR